MYSLSVLPRVVAWVNRKENRPDRIRFVSRAGSHFYCGLPAIFSGNQIFNVGDRAWPVHVCFATNFGKNMNPQTGDVRYCLVLVCQCYVAVRLDFRASGRPAARICRDLVLSDARPRSFSFRHMAPEIEAPRPLWGPTPHKSWVADKVTDKKGH